MSAPTTMVDDFSKLFSDPSKVVFCAYMNLGLLCLDGTNNKITLVSTVASTAGNLKWYLARSRRYLCARHHQQLRNFKELSRIKWKQTSSNWSQDRCSRRYERKLLDECLAVKPRKCVGATVRILFKMSNPPHEPGRQQFGAVCR
uniref:Uncharacterized protein n=1 Tax=Ditylenchus dipsaci TaxID=166011 RepID=A0A915E2R8_9BILA